MTEISKEEIDKRIDERMNQELPPAQRLLIREYMSNVIRKIATWIGIGSIITLVAGVVYIFKIVPDFAVEKIEKVVVENLTKSTSETARKNREALAEVDSLSRELLVSLGGIKASIENLRESAQSSEEDLEEKIRRLNTEVAEATSRQQSAREAIEGKIEKNQNDVDAMANDISVKASDIQDQLDEANAKLVGISSDDADRARELITLFNRADQAETVLRRIEEIETTVQDIVFQMSGLTTYKSYSFITRKGRGVNNLTDLDNVSVCLGEDVPDSVLEAPVFALSRVTLTIASKGFESRGAYIQEICDVVVVPESSSKGFHSRLNNSDDSFILPTLNISELK